MGTKLRTIGHKLRPPARRGMVVVREKKADPFYLSPEWKALMRDIIRARGRRCEDPRHDPASPRDGVRLYGDHIIERNDGGAELDPANVLLRCGPCHGRKTAQARAARARGVGGLIPQAPREPEPHG
jgi:5-methylcytosine-specific restriction protein A